MGSIVVVSAINSVIDVLLMDVFISVAHHRRNEIAIFPVGVAFVAEHGFLGGVFLIFEGDGLFGGSKGGGDVLMLDYKGGDVEAEVFGGAPGHGAVHEDGGAEWLGEVRSLVSVAEDERADYHGALRGWQISHCMVYRADSASWMCLCLGRVSLVDKENIDE